MGKHRAEYTEQDLRELTIAGRDELAAQFEFLINAIREDRFKLEAYFEKFGDLRYRPIISQSDSIEPTYGPPTQVAIEPLASQMRTAIASFLQSINLIQDKIMPQNDVEGHTTAKPRAGEQPKVRASLRDAFAKDAQSDKTPIQPTEPDAELVEKASSPPKAPKSPTKTTDAKPETESKSMATAKSWRETTPRAVAKPATETKPIDEPKPQSTNTVDVAQGNIGLSPALRASLASGASRVNSLRSKYGKASED